MLGSNASFLVVAPLLLHDQSDRSSLENIEGSLEVKWEERMGEKWKERLKDRHNGEVYQDG